jgi:hypothetical protein
MHPLTKGSFNATAGNSSTSNFSFITGFGRVERITKDCGPAFIDFIKRTWKTVEKLPSFFALMIEKAGSLIE